MPQKLLAEREKQRLSHRIFRGVRGLHVDVKSLEVNPHRMSRIRETACSESIRAQQVTELVMDLRLWNRQDGQQAETDQHRNQRGGQHRNSGMSNDEAVDSADS